MSKPDLSLYRAFSERLQQQLKAVPSEWLTQPKAEGKWSPLQVLAHIADAEIAYYDRIKRVLSEDSPTLRGWEQEAWVNSEPNLQADQMVELQLQLIRSIREKLYQLLAALPMEQWQRTCHHPRHGKVTLDALIGYQVSHSENHAESLNY